jgi:glyoxylase-like metal-dependent hydrolase (beta-lactamase superfamily II)
MKSRLTTLLTLALCVLPAFAKAQDVYDVYAIEYARANRYARVADIALNSQSKDSVTFSYYFWYLSGHNGHKVLVDVGMQVDTATVRRSFKSYASPEVALRRLGIQPDEITDVIITHPHYDHIGGLDLFPKAKVWMQKNEYADFVGTAWQKDGVKAGYNKDDVIKTVQANLDGRLAFVNGDSVEILPGIRAFTGSKHTFEGQHLLVATTSEKVLLASDDSWFYFNVRDLVAERLVQDPEAFIRQLKRMKGLVADPSLIIPGHDPLVLSKFTPAAEGIVRIR